jgi:hypothetical protein
MWSATLTSYRAVSESNYLYRNAPQGRDEKALFPGLIPVALGIVALVTVRPARQVWPYLLGMLLAVDLSLGANGLLYPWLYEHLGVFRALRVPARASVLVLLFLGVLAAHGAPAALSKLSPRWREAAATGLVALLLLEYWVAPLRLINYANEPPPLYRFLASQPDGVVAHLPMPSHYRMAGYEPRYIYGSTFHWKPLVNGYSGYHPSSYRDRIEALRDFPSAAAVARLRSDRVRYVVIHEGNYEKAEDAAAALAGLERIGALPLTRLNDGYSAASVFELR